MSAAEKSHSAHIEEIEKYEKDLREVERLKKDYEEKLREQLEEIGRNLSLEEDQVDFRFSFLKFGHSSVSFLQVKEYRKLKEEAAREMVEFSEEFDAIDREQQIDRTNLDQETRIQRDHLARVKQTELRIEELGEKIDKLNSYIA